MRVNPACQAGRATEPAPSQRPVRWLESAPSRFPRALPQRSGRQPRLRVASSPWKVPRGTPHSQGQPRPPTRRVQRGGSHLGRHRDLGGPPTARLSERQDTDGNLRGPLKRERPVGGSPRGGSKKTFSPPRYPTQSGAPGDRSPLPAQAPMRAPPPARSLAQNLARLEGPGPDRAAAIWRRRKGRAWSPG